MENRETNTALHDFDFEIGSWRVHHRRLKERLAGNHEWIEFQGTSEVRKVLGGAGNMEENFLDAPQQSYHAAALRIFDAKTQSWTIWWIDGRRPGHLDPPVVGGFVDGVGRFHADDTFNGKPIRVRYIWSRITPRSCHWEQAFSDDGGETWETNWTMQFERME